MHVLALVLYWVLNVLFYAFLARFIIDLMRSANPALRPKGFWLVLAELVFTVTDPPLRFIRRFIKPMRIGPVALDFSWTVALLLISLLSGLALQLG
jgi:YggT family protein